jgi:hypothetical protein
VARVWSAESSEAGVALLRGDRQEERDIGQQRLVAPPKPLAPKCSENLKIWKASGWWSREAELQVKTCGMEDTG